MAAVVSAGIAVLLALTNSPLSPYVWRDPFPLPSLIVPNAELEGVVRHQDGKLAGPESMAFHPTTGDVFTGLAGGQIVVISADGKNMKNLFFVGGNVENDINKYCIMLNKYI